MYNNYQILKLLEENPRISQRELARILGLSLGKVNYCLQELIRKGLVKAKSFKNSKNKRAYAYIITPKGIEEKGKITVKFLRRKLREYEQLRALIEELAMEANHEKLLNQLRDFPGSLSPDL